MQEKRRRTIFFRAIIGLLATLLFFVAVLLRYAIIWVFKTYNEPKIDEILFTLKVPLAGTNQEFIVGFIKEALVPSMMWTLAFVAVLILLVAVVSSLYRHPSPNSLARKRLISSIPALFFVLAVFAMGWSIDKLFATTNLKEYLQAQIQQSNFIEEEYVDPTTVRLDFPEQKRNLIYIFLESMETTFYSAEQGGFYEQGFTPELEQLALENTTFCADDKLSGLRTMYGGTWTMGAMVTETAGLPLKIPIHGNSYGEFSTFLPGVTMIGEILEDEGYNMELMIGSDADFGGRSNYFSQHGNYEIFDYYTALDRGLKTPEEKVWWGFEDKDLYAYAKDEILELASQDAAFDFTMLTVDTHAQEGWVCELCESEYDEQLANVMACASRQLVDFVRWIQQQDFYENTTIVIVGDHPSMQTAVFEDLLESDYVRKMVNIIINPADQPEKTKNRLAATLDMFPTTLAAIGVGIEGNRLALGTNLFSNTPTLLEEFGPDYVDAELSKSSSFYDKNFVYAN